MWRRGVAAVLAEADYASAEYADLVEWRPGRGGAAVILHVADGSQLLALSVFHADHPHIPVIAVTPTLGVAEYAAVIKAGGMAALGEDEPVATLIATLEHVAAGRASAPPAIMQALALRVAAGFGEPLQIDEVDAARIRALAAGSTVAQLAAESAFSEREMFRLLNELYTRIGVSNRTEAIVWASRHGLLDGATGPGP